METIKKDESDTELEQFITDLNAALNKKDASAIIACLKRAVLINQRRAQKSGKRCPQPGEYYYALMKDTKKFGEENIVAVLRDPEIFFSFPESIQLGYLIKYRDERIQEFMLRHPGLSEQ